MKRSVEFDLFTKIEANARFASKGGMFAKSKRTADQRAAVKAVLNASFGALVPPRYVLANGQPVRNVIRVTLTRIAPGRTADAWENLRGALKGIKDEVAKWCGFDDKEGAGITWLDPGQEQRGQHVYRVRIEITDDAPGPDRVVVLAETASEGRAAASRVKREVKAAGTRHGVSVYRPEAGARAASSAARSKAEGAFAKLTGKPTALDLRDAYLAVVKGAPGAVETARAMLPERPAADTRALAEMRRDPGEERPARDLAACPTCMRGVGEPCKEWPGMPLVFGVHEARAKAAGVHGVHLPPKAPTNGHRRIVPPTQAPLPLPAAYVRLPWEAKPCLACGGAGRQPGSWACGGCGDRGTEKAPLRRDPRHDGEHAPAHVRYAVPAEYRARFGTIVVLTRRRTTLAGIGDVWLYE